MATITMVPPSNQTFYEIQDPHLRYTLASFCFIAGAFAFLGNILVLISSGKYNAIKLDRVSVALIRNLAIADLGYVVFVVVQVGVALVANSWPYDQAGGTGVLCQLSIYLQYALCFADIMLICALNISKLTCILFPLDARFRSFTHGVVCSVVVWVLANIYPLLGVNRDVYFDYRSYRCAYSPSDDYWVWLNPLGISLSLLLPLLTAILTTIWLICYVKRVVGLNRQAIPTVLCVSIVFCVSYAPIGIYIVSEPMIGAKAGELAYSAFYRYAMLVKFINNTANPLIYFFTLKSFRMFVCQKVFKMGDQSDSRESRQRIEGRQRSDGQQRTESRQMT